MTSPQLTQCPKCSTSFRVTPSQLRAAAGSVRCGSCFEVFDALTHQVKESEPVQKTVQEKQPEKINPQPEPQKAAAETPPPLEELTTSIMLPDSSPESFHSLIDSFDKEHIEIEENRERNRVKQIGWVILVLLAVLGLAGQYAWFNKNQLATSLSLRPAYQSVCKLLDCQLPVLKNLDAIKSVQLLVRSLKNQDGLVVDSVILNEAPFSQPWPRLELTFSNINGQIIARRLFRPAEYLGGALAGSQEMPVGKPVRLSLEIVDPGQGAVNYQLRFL